MNDQEPKLRVFAYSPDDEKLYAYTFTETELQETAKTFKRDIFFMMTDSEIAMLEDVEHMHNLKEDFIYYNARVGGSSFWECTCGNFLETDRQGEGAMLRKTVAHARKTGHTISPRGN